MSVGERSARDASFSHSGKTGSPRMISPVKFDDRIVVFRLAFIAAGIQFVAALWSAVSGNILLCNSRGYRGLLLW